MSGRWIVLAGVALLAASRAQAQDTPAPIVFRSGAWVVRRAIDPMTDRPSCVATPLASPFRVEVDSSSLYIAIRPGGVQAVTVRYGEEPAAPLRIATDVERQLGAVALEGEDFAHVLRVARLRVQVLTRFNTGILVDLDLHGALEARQFLLASPVCRAP